MSFTPIQTVPIQAMPIKTMMHLVASLLPVRARGGGAEGGGDELVVASGDGSTQLLRRRLVLTSGARSHASALPPGPASWCRGLVCYGLGWR